MNYTIIDEKLKIYGCHIEDLTLNQITSFLKLWGDDSKIGSLLVLADKDGNVIVNLDNRLHKTVSLVVRAYLSHDYESMESSVERIRNAGTSLKEVFEVLDGAMQLRKLNEWKYILRHVPLQFSFDDIEIDKIYNMNKVHEFGLCMVANMGYIEGIRAERARRKKQHRKN